MLRFPVGEFFRGFHFGEVMVALGLAAIVSAAVLPGQARRAERVSVAIAKDRLRETAVAIESYFVDRDAFPASGCAVGPERRYASELFWQPPERSVIPTGVLTANSFASRRSGAARLVTFRIAGEAATQGLAMLTTPIAYLPAFREDPFARTAGASLGYFAHASNLGWILFSLGPDRDENASDGPGEISRRAERLYDVNGDFPGMWRPGPELIGLGYDPTNGIASEGDIYRIPNANYPGF